jgi:hypothetical protein
MICETIITLTGQQKKTSDEQVSPANGQLHQTKPKACVIMRFGTEGSEDHLHFRSVYANYIKPAVEEAGYECIRADELCQPGEILPDILEMLFNSEICVADLTTSNPNVFYELAIRQLARPEGTILIRDHKRVPDASLPFDIAPLRIHSYEGTAAKAPMLQSTLRDAISAIRAGKGGKSDNHIYSSFHSFIRTWSGLPAGVDLPPGANKIPEMSPWQIILKAEEDANNDRVPKRIIARAHEIAKRRTSVQGATDPDTTADFVDCVKEFFQISVFEPSPNEYVEMNWLATRLDMRLVANAILEEGLRKYPKNRRLVGRRLDKLAHSDKLEVLEAAKLEITTELKLKPGTVDMTYAKDRVDLLGLLLDIYLRQGDHGQALRIVTELKKGQSNPSPFILRNYARAIENSGDATEDEVVQAYKDAVLHPDQDDVAARWLSYFLSGKKRHIDALELTSLACLRDSEYAGYFASLAHDLSIAYRPKRYAKQNSVDRTLPAGMLLDADHVIKAILMARSCNSYDVADQELCELAMKRADIVFADIEEYIQTEQRQEFAQFEREDFVAELYSQLQSTLTT